MKNFYKSVFWVTVAFLLYLIGWSCYKKDISLVKDIGLPLGAILFTVGNLWHIKENQEFELKKHLLERKDKYWDKRFKYYSRLHELIGTINYELMNEDVIPLTDGVDFKDTKLGKVYKTLQELGDEGEILFNNSNISKGVNIKLSIEKIGEKKEILIDKMQAMYTNQQKQKVGIISPGDYVLEQAAYLRDKQDIGKEIEKIFDICRTEIFSYLKLE